MVARLLASKYSLSHRYAQAKINLDSCSKDSFLQSIPLNSASHDEESATLFCILDKNEIELFLETSATVRTTVVYCAFEELWGQNFLNMPKTIALATVDATPMRMS